MASSPSRTASHYRPWTSYFETTDPRKAGTFLSRVYGGDGPRVNRGSARFSLTHVAQGAGPVSSATLTHTSRVEYRPEPLGQLVVGRMSRGRMERHIAGEHLVVGSGDVFLVALPGRPALLRSDDVEIQVVRLDQVVVAELAAEKREGPALFTAGRAVSATAARHCARLLEFLAHDVLGNEVAIASPLVVDHAARLLGAALLATFPNTASAGPDRRSSARATLRHAMAYMDEHAHEPLSLRRIAAAAHVTARTLQLTFRQELGATPTEYLRRVRLYRAHFDLVAADPADGVTVSAVAHRWGFLHLGRFAARYREVYGRSPRETLHSAGRG